MTPEDIATDIEHYTVRRINDEGGSLATQLSPPQPDLASQPLAQQTFSQTPTEG